MVNLCLKQFHVLFYEFYGFAAHSRLAFDAQRACELVNKSGYCKNVEPLL
uniref:Uncharacterized protein n=1 Tax=Anguilla anguilla TaxID=7936 RepID=A0A0E9P7G4_ANGAN